MNERIRQLWAKAAESNFGDSWEEQTAFMSKFAELIVKECLVVINQSNGVGDDDVIKISQDVKKHFGVEE
jgi:hypothetical protein